MICTYFDGCADEVSLICYGALCVTHCNSEHPNLCVDGTEESIYDDENEDEYMNFGAGGLGGGF